MDGFRPLLHATALQDRKQIAPWVVLISALSASSVLAFAWVFPDAASQQRMSMAVAANPGFGLIFGPARDLSSAEGFNDWRALALGGFFAALMAIFIVVRHTRGDEDSGQAELIASAVVARRTRLMVAVALAVVASLALLVVSTLLTTLMGSDWRAALTISATFAASAWMGAGLGAVAAQIASDARTANTIAVGVLGATFLVRGSIDALGHEEWSWITPLGWTQEVRPGSERNLWWLLACVGLAVVLVAAAIALMARRDFGLGIVPPRAGPARGARSVPLVRLARRLHGGPLVTWMLAFVVVGSVFGFLATSLGDVFAKNPSIAIVIAAGKVSEASLTAEFLAMLLRILAILAALAGVQAVMRWYAEELEHRVEPILGAAVSRARAYASTVVMALLGSALLMLVGGLAIALVATRQDVGLSVWDIVVQAIAEIPAVWLLIGIGVLVVGVNPHARLAPWMAIVATFALTILGPLFRLWDWILGISPLWHVPTVNAPDPSYRGLGVLAAIAAVLIAAGFAGYRRRDIG